MGVRLVATLIRCGTLIDGIADEPRRGITLEINDGVITDIRADSRQRAGSDVIDASECTVMPGLIDCHVHLNSISDKTLAQRLLQPYSLAMARALVHARELLDSGVTSARDGAGTPRGIKMALEQGLFPGPRLRIAVGALSQTGGHGDLLMPSGIGLDISAPEVPFTTVDGVENLRQTTRQLLRAGADLIKIHTSGGVMSANDEVQAPEYTVEEIATVVYEAHAARRPVMTHAHSAQGIKNAVEAGVDSIEHGVYADEEALEAMRSHGTFLVPTLLAPIWITRRAEREPGSIPEYALRKIAGAVESHRKIFGAALAAGVKIAMGTDTGVVPHGLGAEELALMVEYGMSPMQAIQAATRTAAACARFDRTGTIDVGQRADLLGVNGDPLTNIGVLQVRDQIALIMQGGRVHKDALSHLPVMA